MRLAKICDHQITAITRTRQETPGRMGVLAHRGSPRIVRKPVGESAHPTQLKRWNISLDKDSLVMDTQLLFPESSPSCADWLSSKTNRRDYQHQNNKPERTLHTARKRCAARGTGIVTRPDLKPGPVRRARDEVIGIGTFNCLDAIRPPTELIGRMEPVIIIRRTGRSYYMIYSGIELKSALI